MQEFIDRHRDCIHGSLSGFDRLIFRGTLRAISYPAGLLKYLNMNGIRLTQFDSFARRCTRRLVQHIEKLANDAGRPCLYLSSAKASKEQVALQIAQRDGIQRGLVCVLSCVEPCISADIYHNRQSKKLEPVLRVRKCKFYYLYLIDEQFGWMHVRIQSWIPFDLQVYINGRSYLQCQLQKAKIGYEKQDNCFTRIDHLPAAQRLIDRLEELNWPKLLGRIVRRLVPGRSKTLLPSGCGYYYWTIRQSEYATDVMFKSAVQLAQVYPRLCREAIERLSSEDVLRFMGKCPSRNRGQQISASQQRLIEGVRVKHRLGENSIKMYDKRGSVLRIETTINDPASLRVYRSALSDPSGKPTWRAMSKSVADIKRRAGVCRDANARYLAALAVVPDDAPASQVLDPLSKPLMHRGQRYRGLRPICPPEEAALFAAVIRGEHLINGLSNASIQRALFGQQPQPREEREKRRRSAAVSRKLRLLRRHRLIHKLGRRRLYRVTQQGQRVMSLALAMRQSSSELLNAA
jgi:hypothetical protein